MGGCIRPGRLTGIYLTLPLTPDFDHAAMEKAVERSRSRWHWFAEGQCRNPALGTLSYLPVEIRWLIWQELAGRETWQKLVAPMSHWGRWWYSPYQYANVCFDVSLLSYRDHVRSYREHVESVIEDLTPNVPVPVLRKGVPLAGLEFEERYLSTTTLEFRYLWEANDTFNDKITPWQIPWIRHLSFVLDSGNDGWLPFFQRYLPPNLRTVTLDLNHDQHLRPYKEYQIAIGRQCGGQHCTVGRHRSTKTILARSCKHYHKSRFLAKKIDRDVGLVEDVTSTLTRDNPLVAIQLGKKNTECLLCHHRCRRILDQINQDWLC